MGSVRMRMIWTIIAASVSVLAATIMTRTKLLEAPIVDRMEQEAIGEGRHN